MAVSPDPAWQAQCERLARAARCAYVRHLIRRAVWREVGGNPHHFTEIMRALLAARPARTDEEIWRDFLQNAARLVAVHLVVAAGICLWDAVPVLW